MEIVSSRPYKEKRKQSFPNILYAMLQHLELEGRADIVSWSSHGRTFHVYNIHDFEQQVLPRYE